MSKKLVPSITEADLAKYTKEKIERLGLFGWRVPLGGVLRKIGTKMVMMKNPMKGFPDFTGCTNDGMMWALELKRAKGKFYPEQIVWQEKLKRHNVIVAVARSYKEIDTFLEALK